MTMTLNQAIKKCVAVASKSKSDRLQYIKIKTVNDHITLMASDSFRIISYEIYGLQRLKFNGLLNLEIVDDDAAQKNQLKFIKITTIKEPEELQKFIVKDKNILQDYPALPVFKFAKHIEIEADQIRRFCKMQCNNNITLKITIGRLILSYKSKEVKTKVETDILKSNIGYFKTALNAKLLKSILPAGKTVKIKIGNSGREPISFGGQIIRPIRIKT